MRSIIPISLLLFCSAASAATLTFDSYVPNGYGSVVTDGYEVSGAGGIIGGPGLPDATSHVTTDPFDASNSLFEATSGTACCGEGYTVGAIIVLERQDSQAFSLYSADWAAFTLYPWGDDGEYYSYPDGFVTVAGELGDGSTITTTDVAQLGQGDWLNIVSVSFFAEGLHGDYDDQLALHVDNIVVGAAVPIPAAVWLFGSALAGLGWLRRKQASQD